MYVVSFPSTRDIDPSLIPSFPDIIYELSITSDDQSHVINVSVCRTMIIGTF